ncbi:MAG: phosphatase PAP2 family protein [Solirubrobacteraceae bacterium]|nr:phosphatase PAP2 family protein [Patulibacter sp.]
MPRLTRPSLPKGWRDLAIQVVVLAAALFVYQLVRGLAEGDIVAADAIQNARHVVALERHLGLYVEPDIQRWSLGIGGLDDILSWVYLNVQTTVTLGGMLWIYLRYNDRYYFVRNMFFTAFFLACVIYIAYPTAPPRLMPHDYGFVDSVADYSGPRKFIWNAFANPYAAMPSMHIGFSLMIGWSIAQLVRRPVVRAFWIVYPAVILFVVVATGNHFWLDALAGAVVGGVGAVAASALGRLRPAAWTWAPNQNASRVTT